MRIVSGRFGGRRLEVPKGRDIRPTSDKVRGAVFNMLDSRGILQGAHVLDVFCGTGALGLEALSRGADFCTFMDKNKDSLDVTRLNIDRIGVSCDTFLVHKDASKMGQRPDSVRVSSLLFLDPPYHKGFAPVALAALDAGGWLDKKGAFCIIEVEKSFNETVPEFYSVVDTRLYGDTKILLLSYERTPL